MNSINQIKLPNGDVYDISLPKKLTINGTDFDGTQDVEIEVAAGSGTSINPNLLDNWYFKDPINSKGQNSYSSGYTIDRWWLNTSKMSVDINSNGLCFTTTSDNNSPAMFLYTFPNDIIKAMASKKVTLSVLAGGHSGSQRFYLTDVNNFADTHKDVSFADGLASWTFTAQDVENGTIAIWCNGASCQIYITAIKLELGDQQTLAHLENGAWVLNEIPDKTEETAKLLYKNDDGTIKMPFVNPNLIDNWYFKDPVNTKGQSNYTVRNEYTVDRWYIGSDDITVSLVDNGIRLVTSAETGPREFRQKLGRTFKVGETLTYSALYSTEGTSTDSGWFRFNLDGAGAYHPMIVSNGANYTLVKETFTVQNEFNHCVIRLPNGSAMTLHAIKLEHGTQQTLAHMENGTWVPNEIPDKVEETTKLSFKNDDGTYKEENDIDALKEMINEIKNSQSISVDDTGSSTISLGNNGAITSSENGDIEIKVGANTVSSFSETSIDLYDYKVVQAPQAYNRGIAFIPKQ